MKKILTAAVVGASMVAMSAVSAMADPIRLKMASTYPSSLTQLGTLGKTLEANIKQAEELLKAESKGAVAALSPSGLSFNTQAHRFHKAILKELLSGNHTHLGDAILAAQARYAEEGSFLELLGIFHLFGDPAMKIQ